MTTENTAAWLESKRRDIRIDHLNDQLQTAELVNGRYRRLLDKLSERLDSHETAARALAAEAAHHREEGERAVEAIGTQQPNPEGWIPHAGGEFPVDDAGANVDVMFRDGDTTTDVANFFVWHHTGGTADIILWRPAKASDTSTITAGPDDVSVSAAPEPDEDGWIPHDGKSWPACGPRSSVEVQMRDGSTKRFEIAEDCRWRHKDWPGDVVAWRPAPTD